MTATPGLSRRSLLRGALGAAASRLVLPAAVGTAIGGLPAMAAWAGDDPARPGSRLDRMVSLVDPVIHLVNAHTKEETQGRFFTATGYDMAVVERLNWIWRDWRDNEASQIDPRLFWAVAVVRASAMKEGHNGQVTLLSGYRTKKTTQLLRSQGVNAALDSQHMKARAVDMRLAGIPASRISGFVEWLQVGGTGHYPGSNFTHADSGSLRKWRG